MLEWLHKIFVHSHIISFLIFTLSQLVLCHEALLLLRRLIDLVYNYVLKFPIICLFWSDMLSIAWYILDLLNIYICICFGKYSEGIPVLQKIELQTRVMHDLALQKKSMHCLLFSIFHLKLLASLLVQVLMFWNSIGTLTNISHSANQILMKILSST